MFPYQVEIWRSDGGSLLDASFYPIAILTSDYEDGPFSLVDVPKEEGQLYAYKARRQRMSDGAYSDFSDPALVRAPERDLQGDTPEMCMTTPTGVKTSLGFALQADNCFGGGVKADHLHDYRSGYIGSQREIINGESLINQPSTFFKSAPDKAMFDGSFEVWLSGGTPLAKALTAVFGDPNTTGSGPYTHTWKNSFDYRLISVVQKIGDTINFYPDGVLNRLSFSGSRDQNEPFAITMGVMPNGRVVAAAIADVQDVSAGYDPLPRLQPLRTKVYMNPVGNDAMDAPALVSNHNIEFSRDFERLMTYNGLMGAQEFSNSGTTASVEATLLFSNENELKRFMGHAPSRAKPFGFTASEVRFNMIFEFTFAIDAVTTGSLIVQFPSCCIQEAEEPVQGRDSIRQTIRIQPYFDETAETDVIVKLTNSTSNAVVIEAGDPVAREILEENAAVWDYVEKGDATGTPTTTVIASSAGTFSPYDDIYIGRTLRVLTGAAAGEERTVTDYVAATKTFTVGVAFSVAPTAGDLIAIS
jgi:hypothetical protein